MMGVTGGGVPGVSGSSVGVCPRRAIGVLGDGIDTETGDSSS